MCYHKYRLSSSELTPRNSVIASWSWVDQSLYKCDFSEFDPCKMGEFFVNAVESEFLANSCSILCLPSSITWIQGYGSTSIFLFVNALADFCGTIIALSMAPLAHYSIGFSHIAQWYPLFLRHQLRHPPASHNSYNHPTYCRKSSCNTIDGYRLTSSYSW